MEFDDPELGRNRDSENSAARTLTVSSLALIVGGLAMVLINVANPKVVTFGGPGTGVRETKIEVTNWAWINAGASLAGLGVLILIGLGFFWAWRSERRRIPDAYHLMILMDRDREKRLRHNASTGGYMPASDPVSRMLGSGQ